MRPTSAKPQQTSSFDLVNPAGPPPFIWSCSSARYLAYDFLEFTPIHRSGGNAFLFLKTIKMNKTIRIQLRAPTTDQEWDNCRFNSVLRSLPLATLEGWTFQRSQFAFASHCMICILNHRDQLLLKDHDLWAESTRVIVSVPWNPHKSSTLERTAHGAAERRIKIDEGNRNAREPGTFYAQQ